MMGLAPCLGRQTAHGVVYDACRLALAEHRPGAGGWRANHASPPTWTGEAIERLCDPAHYLGAAPRMVDRMRAARRSAN